MSLIIVEMKVLFPYQCHYCNNHDHVNVETNEPSGVEIVQCQICFNRNSVHWWIKPETSVQRVANETT